jgi:tetratricopeptide (TPR) repeat protein
MDRIVRLFKIADQETKEGNYLKAVEAYKEILRLSEKDKRTQHIAHWGIGDIYLNNKQYSKAKYHLKKAVRLDPYEPIYNYLLGCTYTYLNEIDDAISHLEKATELDDSQDIFWGQLGWVYGYNRDIDKGIEYLKRALALNPINVKSLKDICMLYAKNQKWSEALVCIEEAMEQDSDNSEIIRIKQDIEFFESEFKRLKGNKGIEQSGK